MAHPPATGEWSAKNEAFAAEAKKESWSAWILEIEAEKGFEICGARRRDNSPCRRPMVKDNRGGRCRSHGGYAVVGVLHGRYTHGRSSKYDISGKLAAAYERGQDMVQNILDLEPDIRLLDARMIELIDRLSVGGVDPGEMLKLIRDQREQVRDMVPEDRQRYLLGNLQDMEDLVYAHQRDEATWKEWHSAVAQKKELIQAEDTRRSREHGPMFWTDMLFIIEKIKNIVLTHTEREQQVKIMREFELLMPQQKLIGGKN